MDGGSWIADRGSPTLTVRPTSHSRDLHMAHTGKGNQRRSIIYTTLYCGIGLGISAAIIGYQFCKAYIPTFARGCIVDTPQCHRFPRIIQRPRQLDYLHLIFNSPIRSRSRVSLFTHLLLHSFHLQFRFLFFNFFLRKKKCCHYIHSYILHSNRKQFFHY